MTNNNRKMFAACTLDTISGVGPALRRPPTGLNPSQESRHLLSQHFINPDPPSRPAYAAILTSRVFDERANGSELSLRYAQRVVPLTAAAGRRRKTRCPYMREREVVQTRPDTGAGLRPHALQTDIIRECPVFFVERKRT